MGKTATFIGLIAVAAIGIVFAAWRLGVNQGAQDGLSANAQAAVEKDCDCKKDKLAAQNGAEGDSTSPVPKEVSIDVLAEDIEAAKKGFNVYDANGPDTRRKLGLIPGAVALSHYSKYGEAELPKDKASKLVFYCGSTQCTASDKAADRAIALGYRHVQIFREGIKGWIDAGYETQKL